MITSIAGDERLERSGAILIVGISGDTSGVPKAEGILVMKVTSNRKDT